jgi:hypothetical protein
VRSYKNKGGLGSIIALMAIVTILLAALVFIITAINKQVTISESTIKSIQKEKLSQQVTSQLQVCFTTGTYNGQTVYALKVNNLALFCQYVRAVQFAYSAFGLTNSTIVGYDQLNKELDPVIYNACNHGYKTVTVEAFGKTVPAALVIKLKEGAFAFASRILLNNFGWQIIGSCFQNVAVQTAATTTATAQFKPSQVLLGVCPKEPAAYTVAVPLKVVVNSGETINNVPVSVLVVPQSLLQLAGVKANYTDVYLSDVKVELLHGNVTGLLLANSAGQVTGLALLKEYNLTKVEELSWSYTLLNANASTPVDKSVGVLTIDLRSPTGFNSLNSDNYLVLACLYFKQANATTTQPFDNMTNAVPVNLGSVSFAVNGTECVTSATMPYDVCYVPGTGSYATTATVQPGNVEVVNLQYPVDSTVGLYSSVKSAGSRTAYKVTLYKDFSPVVVIKLSGMLSDVVGKPIAVYYDGKPVPFCYGVYPDCSNTTGPSAISVYLPKVSDLVTLTIVPYRNSEINETVTTLRRALSSVIAEMLVPQPVFRKYTDARVLFTDTLRRVVIVTGDALKLPEGMNYTNVGLRSYLSHLAPLFLGLYDVKWREWSQALQQSYWRMHGGRHATEGLQVARVTAYFYVPLHEPVHVGDEVVVGAIVRYTGELRVTPSYYDLYLNVPEWHYHHHHRYYEYGLYYLVTIPAKEWNSNAWSWRNVTLEIVEPYGKLMHHIINQLHDAAEMTLQFVGANVFSEIYKIHEESGISTRHVLISGALTYYWQSRGLVQLVPDVVRVFPEVFKKVALFDVKMYSPTEAQFQPLLVGKEVIPLGLPKTFAEVISVKKVLITPENAQLIYVTANVSLPEPSRWIDARQLIFLNQNFDILGTEVKDMAFERIGGFTDVVLNRVADVLNYAYVAPMMRDRDYAYGYHNTTASDVVTANMTATYWSDGGASFAAVAHDQNGDAIIALYDMTLPNGYYLSGMGLGYVNRHAILLSNVPGTTPMLVPLNNEVTVQALYINKLTVRLAALTTPPQAT